MLMTPKGEWLRAKRARERAAKADVTYDVKSTRTPISYDEHGRMHGGDKIVDIEPFRKVYEVLDGTRITVDFSGFGSNATFQYEIDSWGDGKRRITLLDEQGHRRRSHVINSASALRNRLDGAIRITIHGRDLAAERREARQRDKEFWEDLQRAYEKQKAKEGKK